MNAPVAATAPSSVLLSAVVGVPEVFQHTPCCVGFGAPKPVIFPFPVAVVIAMSVTACVVTVGASGFVVNETWVPYTVPAVFVA